MPRPGVHTVLNRKLTNGEKELADTHLVVPWHRG
jgi:hypothetical protein